MAKATIDSLPQANLQSRRHFLCATAATLLAGAHFLRSATAQQTSTDSGVSDAEVIDILKEESEPGFIPRVTIENYWFQAPEEERPSPNWPSDDVSYDYRQFGATSSIGTRFRISGSVLRALAAANSFSLRPHLVNVLFGLRGCMLVDGQEHTSPARTHEVVTARPNHLRLRCLLGVWNTQTDEISLFAGSTVSNVDLMHGYVIGTLACNMMPTGLHEYRVGPHRGNRQPGAFRQQKSLWVLRSRANLGYAANDRDDVWDDLNGDLPFDNIHAAMLNGRAKPPFFSSAGCQVVAGRYSNGVPTGAWAEFRKAAGLTHPPVVKTSRGESEDDGREFDYMLLTGDETALFARDLNAPFKALRYGSSGPKVIELQEKLGLDKDYVDGGFGRRALGNYILWQRDQKRAPTGIVSIVEARTLGLNWTS
jgi:hypothetical protein